MSKLTKALTAAAGNAGGDPLYVEDVFSTYLYTGNSSTQTITNGIDLAGEGGMIWQKSRSNATNHYLVDTVRGAGDSLNSDTTAAAANGATDEVTGWNADGYGITASGSIYSANASGQTYASWTFRKAEKFFDVVTWTGDGTSTRNIDHNLGAAPGMLIVKRTDGADSWWVYHTSLNNNGGNPYFLQLESTSGQDEGGGNFTTPSDTQFGVRTNINSSGGTYVAYLFASDAGGFGDDGSENIIKCGSYSGANAALSVNCGFEPQYVLIKKSNGAAPWVIEDIMRGMTMTSDSLLYANSSVAEEPKAYQHVTATPTGFDVAYANADTTTAGSEFIYIAIRRPMKTPASGTEVFSPDFQDASDPSYSTGFVVDAALRLYRPGGGAYTSYMVSRLTGDNRMTTTSTDAEEAGGSVWAWDFNNGWGQSLSTSTDVVSQSFKRATGFMDVVAYTGTSSSASPAFYHNLGVLPEFMIFKSRSGAVAWQVWHKDLPIYASDAYKGLYLNTTAAADTAGVVATSRLTSTYFTGPAGGETNTSGQTYVCYMFATLAGVSKVGSYTGTGADLNVDCGFSAGARFILIKRTDSTGDWYVWDSARGISAGNDPYLLLNSTAAEVTGTDYVDPLSAGFTVTSSAPAALNASGGTYIFLAIA